MFSPFNFKFEISDLKFEKRGTRSHSDSIDRLSPQDPRAMYRKLINSAVVPRSKPSAMLFEIESVDLSSWFLVSPSPRISAIIVNLKTSSANSTAVCHTGRSSNRLYFKVCVPPEQVLGTIGRPLAAKTE